MHIRTTFYYDGERSENTVAGDNVDDEADNITDNGVHAPIGRALLASSTDEHSSAGTEGARPFDVDGLAPVLNYVSVPHCVTHKPARSDCPVCIIVKRRDAHKLAGVPTTIANTYVDILTMAHFSITDGRWPSRGWMTSIRAVHQR